MLTETKRLSCVAWRTVLLVPVAAPVVALVVALVAALLVYELVLACSGQSFRLPKGAADPTNCARTCCGDLGACLQNTEACSKGKPHMACSVRVRITATVSLVKQGKFHIELKGLHVPTDITRVPPPICGLRIDQALKRQLVQQCKSSKQTPTTAIADLLPELKLAQRSGSNTAL